MRAVPANTRSTGNWRTRLLLKLPCWLAAPRQFALGNAGQAFDTHGVLHSEAHRQGVQGVVEQVLWASTRLHD